MLAIPIKKSFTIASLICLSCISHVHAQDASQLGFSDLQAQANSLVEQGQLEQAMPLLEELIKRVEATDNSDIKLDFPIFLLGTAHIQRFVGSGNAGELNKTLEWYDKLQKDYPQSPKVKDALLKKVDVLRILKREDDAVALMKQLLDGTYSIRLNLKQESKLLKDLTQIYYNKGDWKDGLPIFAKLMNTSRNFEDKAWAAAASFEAYVAEKRLDDAMALLPILARESEVRYLPRLNVALLKTSDTMVAQARLSDAAILLNLIKTTDIMIEHNEAAIVEKQARIKFNQDMGRSSEATERLKQEVKGIEATLTQLRKLPTLRNELLVRRARNYTKTARRYEAFWMFSDLMTENPNDPQVEFYTYATFSNALQLKKTETAMKVGKAYLNQFPNGDFYSDITIALVSTLKDSGDTTEYVQLAKDFLDTHPLDVVSSNLLALWAGHYMEEGDFATVIKQTTNWLKQHNQPIFEDGLYYWCGLSQLQTGAYDDAIANFSNLLKKYPTSIYAEDGLLRKGAAQFYAQKYEESRNTLYSYTKEYPRGNALDQAYYFLGEVENLAGDLELALQHFKKADDITTLQDIHDGVAFSMGTIYEQLGRYEEMATHFIAYTERFGEQGRLTDAVFELGRANEFLRKPNQMLALYREYIQKFANDPENDGVDALIEGYAEKYNTNKATLVKTVEFLDALDNDLEFRTKIVTDRGYLFEYFYVNNDLDQTLYNRLRNHPQFDDALVNDLTPIREVTDIYRQQLVNYPTETPIEFFRAQLAKAKASKKRIAETRMLMGLYRSDVELAPSRSYDSAFLSQVTPRVILYIADYSRADRLNFAVEAWNTVLTEYPTDDAAIVSYMRLADVSERRGDKPAALNYLKAIEAQFPGTPQLPAVILRQGELLSAMGRGDEAREKYQYILRVPDWRGIMHARALFQTGEAYMAENKYPEARGFFERTYLGYSNISEWAARAYLADANALLALGEKADAANVLAEAVETLSETAPPELMTPIQTKLKEIQPSVAPSPQS
ncbi:MULTISPECIES: tetratricopeptide repeat protein [unclassified Lentimonas]|uniref:tetratricopeptide repeat protein n=1 Tax=unclassified Lentimonas TaxID=2630993 RepID=UPI001389FA9B|nr:MULTISPECIES: tetratricopeptide repeat protein [unclassified Lentimonas]